ncbi:rod shape-determining protein MreC [[Bacillus] enclensis]|uniref:Cell shape-determining protein MreC n=1 Tax=[Bacillus] enclensis TaxID=1402860 RepID=A0A0V8HMJ4_9BACI|nr:rod shape-determining protein MreC [[Bacillus] enclensis]KSU63862.1 rod shape-determining protein MreC [[Bacillus] enclensis]QTC43668.1 rod shape-determining protein MreC [Bacillus sp. V3]QWC21843.1 rod shape-determining protein MreC [Bacillus haikouensis]SCB90866.1 rod shape-determining protein MreC [[Bacillus] enclensis]
MPQFFLNKRLIILLVSIIVLVALIGFSLRERDSISWPEQFVKDMVGFGQSIVSKPVNYTGDIIDNVKDLQNTYTENEKLKSRLDELVKLETQVRDLKQDNEELRDVLKKKEDLRSYDTIQATVIARNPDHWQELITIDKGEVNGIKSDMAVISAAGLIGKVKSVNEFSSTVELISTNNTKNRISTVIQGKQDINGWIEGYDSDKKEILVKRIPNDLKVEKGSKVITSGLGGVFPKGLVVGEVKEVKPDQYGLTQTAYVKPAADFYHLEHVMVIDREMKGVSDSQAEEETGEEEQ